MFRLGVPFTQKFLIYSFFLISVFFLLRFGCYQRQESHRELVMSDRTSRISEIKVVKSILFPITPEGPAWDIISSKSRYFFTAQGRDPLEIEMLRREKMFYPMGLFSIAGRTNWLAVETIDLGVARVFLFSGPELVDTAKVKFTHVDGKPSFSIYANTNLSFYRDGAHHLMYVSEHNLLTNASSQLLTKRLSENW